MDSNQIRFAVFLGVFSLMVIAEHFLPRHPRVDSKLRRFAINLSLTGLNILLIRLVFGAAAVGVAHYAGERGLGLFNLVELPGAVETLAAVVLLDLMIYLQHVVVHYVPLFWWFHIVHHSDLDLDVSSGLRFHPVEILGSMLFKVGLVLALGPSPLAVVIFEAVLNGMAMFSHSNVRLPDALDRALRYLIVTPDMHRIHHSVERRETDSNFGFNLSVWDRLFKTYRADAQKPQPEIVIGVPPFRRPEDVRFLKLLLMPAKRGGAGGGQKDGAGA